MRDCYNLGLHRAAARQREAHADHRDGSAFHPAPQGQAMTPFDYEQARYNMVEQQIRTWDVLDQRVLDLLFAVKREDFVPAAHR